MKHTLRIETVFVVTCALAAAACLDQSPAAPNETSDGSPQVRAARGGAAPAIVFTKLPSLGSNSEALAVDGAGTVITGHSFDRAGMLYAVKWTLVNGSWTITTLPYSGSDRALGVNDLGEAVGHGGTSPRRALQWSAAGVARQLDCQGDAGESIAYGTSAGAHVVVGAGAGIASIWRVNGCRETLPSLGSYSSAATASGDGTILGGSAELAGSTVSIPVRWREAGGAWSIEQLDARSGRAMGANTAGDLAGYVRDICNIQAGCNRSVVWYASGVSRTIAAGGESNWANDVNSSGEVVGITTSNGRSSGYIWSETGGVREIAAKGKDAIARAVSNVRADGTRLVVGMVGTQAAVWLVRN